MQEKEQAAYLKRIHCDAPEQPDEEGLGKLIRCHLETVPFENLDVLELKKVPVLTETALFDKIVLRERGGYCFELNTLFLRLLESFGYTVYPVAARVVWNKEDLPPVSHMGLVAEIAGEKYFCDVGFGGPGPKGILKLSEQEQVVDGERFRVRSASNGDLLIQRLHHEEWKNVLRFRDIPMTEVDFQLLNFYCARNENVIFTKKRVVNLCTPSGSKALSDMELTIRDGDQTFVTVYADEAELRAGLENEFGLK
jgi:N-hydroxyarylamine O-acetyltransferase